MENLLDEMIKGFVIKPLTADEIKTRLIKLMNKKIEHLKLDNALLIEKNNKLKKIVNGMLGI